METQATETINAIKTLIDLGLSAILLYFLFVVWKDRKELETKKDKIIEGKDIQAQKSADTILEVVRENTKTQETLRATINESTRATETLTSRIYDLLNK